MTDILLVTPYSDRPQCGKTTLADYLVHKYGFARHSIAAPLKRAVAAMIYGNCSHESLAKLEQCKDAPHASLDGMTPRDVLRILGHGIRVKHPDALVNICARQIAKAVDQGHTRHVVDDMRWPNEWWRFEATHKIAIKLVKPTCGEANDMEGLLADRCPDLLFEVQDGSHDELYRLTDLFMEGRTR